MFLLDKILPLIFNHIRPCIKWFLHIFTRLCELQRVCYGARPGASRTRQVERSLVLSKQPDIRGLLIEFDECVEFSDEMELLQIGARAVRIVQLAKHIKPSVHPDFGRLFGDCVITIWGYKHLMCNVENLRAEPYDANNLAHEEKLLELWKLLMPAQPLENRITKQWQDIGFQGDDPKTDFRGMGLLGLENLLYFAHFYNDAARHVLSHSMHPTLGYTFAIVGINLTAMAYRLLKTGSAKTHFYNLAAQLKRYNTLEDFHKLYCFLFFEFDRYWIDAEPQNIMDFREIYQSFEITILEALHNDKTVFKTNLAVENV